MRSEREKISEGITLRKMVESDLDFVSDLAMLANPFSNKERYRKFLISQLREFPDLTFVATTRDTRSVIGYVTADVEGDEACIEDISVAESFQRRGIGKLLLNHIVGLLEKRQVGRIKLEVHYKRSSAIPFYYTFGFRLEDCVLDRFGKGEDATVLTKRLPNRASATKF